MVGITIRHGPHQLAQKSTTTTLPFRSANDTSLPLRSFSLNSGAGFPSYLSASAFIAASPAACGSVNFATCLASAGGLNANTEAGIGWLILTSEIVSVSVNGRDVAFVTAL